MGSSVTATCDCGLAADILIGGGALTFTTECSFPCLCRSCRNVVEVNLLVSDRRCPDCQTPDTVPYDSPDLVGLPGSRAVAELRS